jgi:uncharacterized protein YgiM (DUF1202 family)
MYTLWEEFQVGMRRFLYFITVFIILALGFGCAKEEASREITLPPTSVLSIQSNWGVVASTHLRLRDNPSIESKAVTTLWSGSVVEILTKTGKEEQVEGETDYWYQVSFEGLTGWVFGAYLEIYSTEEEAEAVSRELK